MAKKRAAGEGSIFQRSNGRWAGQTPPDPLTGKVRTIYGKTQGDVRQKLETARRALVEGLPAINGRQTVEKFLTRWLEDVIRPNVRPATYRSYELNVRRYLIPALGKRPLAQLTPQDVQAFLNAQRKAGLSDSTVKQTRDVLRAALNQALRWGEVGRNVASLATLPRAAHHERGALDRAEAGRLLTQVRGDRLEALYAVAVSLGLRLGEVLGLRWADVDLAGRTLRVTGAMRRVGKVGDGGGLRRVEPKSRTSRRAVDLPEGMIRALREHKAGQDAERARAGARWREHDLVFATRYGTPLDGPNVTLYFQRHLAAAGLPRMPFHSLRHSCASLLAAQGYSAFDVSRLLGHSDVRLTINTYTHEFAEGRRHLADAMGWMFDDDGGEDAPASAA